MTPGRAILLCVAAIGMGAVAADAAASPVLIDVGPVKINKSKRTATVNVTTAGDLAEPAECTLDSLPAEPCLPVMRFTNVSRGRHILRVEATPADGSPITAVSKAFVMTKKKKKKGHKRT